DGKLLAGVEETTLVLRDPRTGKILHRFPDLDGPFVSSPDGALAAAVKGASLQIIDLHARKPLRTIPDHAHARISALPFSRDTRRLALLGLSCLSVWDVETGRCLTERVGHKEPVSVVALSGGRLLASGSYDGRQRLWGLRPRKHLHDLLTRRPAWCMAF